MCEDEGTDVRDGKCFIGCEIKNIPYTLFKKTTVLKKVCTTGKLNGAIKPYSVAVLAKKLVLECYSIITLTFK